MTDAANRLKKAREHAGYETAKDAADGFGWKYPTYVGHENGLRGIKPANYQKYARAFRVSLDWLMTGHGTMTTASGAGQATQRQHSGFSESAADLYEFIAATDRQKTNLRRIVELLCPDTRNPILYRLSRAYPGLMLAEGDILVVDQHSKADNGQIALVQAVDEQTGAGSTRLKTRYGTELVPPFGETRTENAAENQAEYGVVIATIRTDLIS